MAEDLAVGKVFKSFDALQNAVNKYEQTCFAQMSRTDSRTIENEETRRNIKLYNPRLKYSFVTFTCAFGGKPYVSRSTGIRNSKPRIKCNCPVILKCFASQDGQSLVVRHSALDCHNHDTSEESFKALPRGRLLDEETELEIFNLIESHENKKLARKLIREKLIEETGREITYKDIQNIEKRMNRRRDQGERNEHTEDDEEMSNSVPSDQEMEEQSKEDAKPDSGEDKENSKVEEETEQKEEENTTKETENAKEKENTDQVTFLNSYMSFCQNKVSSSVKEKTTSKSTSTPKKRSTATRTTSAAATTTSAASSPPGTRVTSSGTGRPRRSIREPTRFRDPEITKSSSASLKRRASDSENSWEESDSESETTVKKEAPDHPTPAPASRRGRKPLVKREKKSPGGGKTAAAAMASEAAAGSEEGDGSDPEQPDSATSANNKGGDLALEDSKKLFKGDKLLEKKPVIVIDKLETPSSSSSSSSNNSLASKQLEMEERKLKIQEEMLNLQRQSMMLLQNVVQRLDRVEANQAVVSVKKEVTDGGDAASSTVATLESDAVTSQSVPGTVDSNGEDQTTGGENTATTQI